MRVPLEELLGDPDLAVLASPVRMPVPPLSLLEAMPRHAVEKALWWEGHILEVLHGRGPEAAEDARPRPEYDPSRHSLTARERAKAAELTAAGRWPPEELQDATAEEIVEAALSYRPTAL